MSDDADIEELKGRIVALELMTRAFLVSYVMENFPNPTEALASIKGEMFGSAQMLQRAAGPHEDAVWEEAVKALEKLFVQAGKRLAGIGDQS